MSSWPSPAAVGQLFHNGFSRAPGVNVRTTAARPIASCLGDSASGFPDCQVTDPVVMSGVSDRVGPAENFPEKGLALAGAEC